MADGPDLEWSRAASRISFLSRVAYFELPTMPRFGLATKNGRRLCHLVASSCAPLHLLSSFHATNAKSLLPKHHYY